MTDLTSLTIAEARDKLRAKEITADRADRGLSLGDRRANAALNAYVAVTPDKALRHGQGLRRPLAAGKAGALKAFRSASRICSPPRASTPRPAAISSTASSRDTNRPSPRTVGRRRRHARQAQHGRVRHGLVQRDLVLRPGGQPLASRRLEHSSWCPAARPAVRPLPLPRISAPARPRPIPAARSASRPPSPAPSASSRPMAAARAGASSRSPPRSTRPARSPATCAMPRSC